MTTTNQPSDAAKDLLPCPFCGSSAHTEYRVAGWIIRCSSRFENCPVNGRTHHCVTQAEAITAWNTRADRHLTPSEPVAYLYQDERGDKELLLDCNGEHAARLIVAGYAETPLYATPPAPVNSDAGLVEDQCANCHGMIGDLAQGRDPEELCDTCYMDSQATPAVNAELVDAASGVRSLLDLIASGLWDDCPYPDLMKVRIAAFEAALSRAKGEGA